MDRKKTTFLNTALKMKFEVLSSRDFSLGTSKEYCMFFYVYDDARE